MKYSKEYCIWLAKDVNTPRAIIGIMRDEYSASILSNQRSYRITLPKEIVREKGWRKGDRLSVTSEDDRIILRIAQRDGRIRRVFYSIGYEGKDLSEFTDYLTKHDVKQLIDVRRNPFSYKAGFSKAPLRKELAEAGITYIHIPDLGPDTELRREYKATGDLGRLLDEFEKKLKESQEPLSMVKALVNYRTSAIMCFEDDFTQCHRSIIENMLNDDGLSVVHLCSGKQRGFF